MPPTADANRAFLEGLFAGPMRGHAIVFSPVFPEAPGPGDVSSSRLPVERWVDFLTRMYETRVDWQRAIGDDSVPYAAAHTGTQVFAAAFGCNVHVYPDSPAMALPRVTTSTEADALDVPAINAPPLDRIWRAAELLRRRLGPNVPLAVPDIQSPLDIAALIWRKEEFLMAMVQEPEAVKRLIDKCRRLLTAFLTQFHHRFGDVNYCHCPYAWAPPELGCWLSEDEVGSISPAMFRDFAAPSLRRMSADFGGLFVHCCATADHQYPQFKSLPRLRGLNRVFQAPGAGPAIEAFTPDTVLMVAWYDEKTVGQMLDMARPETRFLLNMSAPSIEEAKALFERLRARCPRRDD